MAQSEPACSEYKLRCTILGHSSDVRAVAVTACDHLLTASRDNTAKLWAPDTGGYTCATEYLGHTGYVTSVCSLPPNTNWSDGLTITGSRDSTILVFLPSHATACKQLSGHTDTVSCLTCSGDVLVSGSWDHTARVWSTTDTTSSTFPCQATLKAHTGPLWAVALIDKDTILTAAADMTILLWRQGKVLRKFVGHSDCVRGLAVVDGNTFLSCSNDASIRRWDAASGACLDIYYGHTNFIYSVSVLPCGGFVSGSEDRSARVWDKTGSCRQTLHLPCQSAWSVAALANSDVIVGTSDGACRVFTPDPQRAASTAEQKEFADQVAASARPAAAELGGVKPDQLPDKTALLQPGKKDGHTLMVREDGKVMCYSWTAVKGQWEAVGEVVGGTGGSAPTSGKVLYEGREYDYVFSVELDEGGALKLPYNNSEDPFVVAQRFIDEHQLPQDHLDQVAQFIITNSNAAPTATSTGYFDPFTGGNRYVPGASSSSGVVGSDPFTSSSRYTPSGGGGRVPASTHYPQTTSLLFEACNRQGITIKLKENNQLVDEKVRLNDGELQQLLDAIFFDGDDASSIRAEGLGPLEKTLQWSPERVWPSLDLLRLCLRSSAVQDRWIKGDKGASIVSLLTSLLRPPSPAASQLLAIRCLANLAAHPPGCNQLTTSADQLLATVTELAPFPNKNLEIASATLLLNCSVLLTRKTKELSDLCQVVSGLGTILLSCKEPEAQYRALVGLGTVLSSASAECRQFAITLDLRPLLEGLAQSSCIKVRECSTQLVSALTS